MGARGSTTSSPGVRDNAPATLRASTIFLFNTQMKTSSLLLQNDFSFLVLCIWVSCVYIFTTCVSGAHGGKRGALDPLELKLQMFVSCHAGLGIQPEPSRGAASTLKG